MVKTGWWWAKKSWVIAMVSWLSIHWSVVAESGGMIPEVLKTKVRPCLFTDSITNIIPIDIVSLVGHWNDVPGSIVVGSWPSKTTPFQAGMVPTFPESPGGPLGFRLDISGKNWASQFTSASLVGFTNSCECWVLERQWHYHCQSIGHQQNHPSPPRFFTIFHHSSPVETMKSNWVFTSSPLLFNGDQARPLCIGGQGSSRSTKGPATTMQGEPKRPTWQVALCIQVS